mmetsp:Transcript_19905/g.60382  ORF Transcript_19905/g.60382 Transcript_19905/m.60382 type:complete len:121 (+) Transcript_19905:271-633(+)
MVILSKTCWVDCRLISGHSRLHGSVDTRPSAQACSSISVPTWSHLDLAPRALDPQEDGYVNEDDDDGNCKEETVASAQIVGRPETVARSNDRSDGIEGDQPNDQTVKDDHGENLHDVADH